MPLIKASDLEKVAIDILSKAGSEEAEAVLVAKNLVLTNLLGHDSHGVGMVPLYVQNIYDGFLKPNMPARLIKEDGSILIFDGQQGFGQRVAFEAMEAAISKCKGTGTAVMALRNAHHIGRIGSYGEQSIEAGLVSIHFVNVIARGSVAPYGGRDGRFSTNPVCIAMPGTEHTEPVVLDMATSKIAMGKARVAMNAGKKLSDDVILDPDGNPTNDPAVMFANPRGALRAFGLHKGYGIALFCDLLAGAIGGGGTLLTPRERQGGLFNNMLVFIIDPGRFVDAEWRQREIDALVAHVKGSPPEDPENPVMVAGDPERKSLAERQEKGIPLDPSEWENILQAGEKVGIKRDVLESYIS